MGRIQTYLEPRAISSRSLSKEHTTKNWQVLRKSEKKCVLKQNSWPKKTQSKGNVMRPLQQKLSKTLRVKPTINPEEEIRKTVDFLKAYLVKHPFLNGYVLGISGGQDSTLAGKLAQMAIDELNEEQDQKVYRFYAVRLPYGGASR